MHAAADTPAFSGGSAPLAMRDRNLAEPRVGEVLREVCHFAATSWLVGPWYTEDVPCN
jgi:hypothetical protein